MKPGEDAPPAPGAHSKTTAGSEKRDGSKKRQKRDSLHVHRLKKQRLERERDVAPKLTPEGPESSPVRPPLQRPAIGHDTKVHTIRPPFRHVTKGPKPAGVVEDAAAPTGHQRQPSRVNDVNEAAIAGGAPLASPTLFSNPMSPGAPPGPTSPMLSGNVVAFPAEVALSPPRLPGDQMDEEGPKPAPVSRALKLGLMLSLCALAVILSALTALVIINTSLFSDVLSSGVCKTHACLAYSERLLSSLDDTVNPCRNFTRFVCDGWQKASERSVKEVQFQGVLDKLTSLLKNIDVPPTGQNEEQRAAAVYRSCMDLLEDKKDELAAVQKALNDAGIVWPYHSTDANVPYTLLYCSLKLGWDVLLDFDVVTPSGGSRVELVVSVGKLLLFVANKAIRLRTTGGGQVYYDNIKVRFGRNAAAGVTYDQMVDIEDYALRTIKGEFDYAETAQRVESFLNAPDLGVTEDEWMAALRALNASVAARLTLTSMTPEYVETMLRVWRRNGSRSFHAFVSWCTVQVAALFANDALIYNYYDQDYDTAKLYHGVFCVTRAMYFSTRALFAKYNADVLKGNADEGARKMAMSVRRAFSRRLFNWTYFDESVTVVGNWTSQEAVFSNFEPLNGAGNGTNKLVQSLPDTTNSFVNNWKQSVLIRTPLEVQYTMQSVYGLDYYLVLYGKGDFQLMPYALSFPLFDSGLPSSVNYGGFGSEVARALGTLFLYSYNNASEFVNASMIECMREGHTPSYKGRKYAEQAVGLGALVDAYDSARRASDMALQGLEKYSGLQLIFIALCYVHCKGSATNEAGEPVCDIPLRHVPEFAEAFHCAPGDPMNPLNRCELL
ncbi:hypothetical protein HPB50_005560 [Hyalomma asiaticum]|uniref:Uncharacterized protein n=1 Tax=Hyalomma asiaticum TaxID=266040 RepID=A0ACB7SL92_HYAAI|nr:hypothetical protein HPB50_005560 [Hyalomma asiaticum]